MQIQLSTSSLSDGRWYEYLVRFALGGAANAFTGLISSTFGASIGGLFLALPAIFCASATLIESHERRAKEKAGLSGRRRGQQAAALDAAGAGLGSIGLAAFASVFYVVVQATTIGAFVAAILVWAAVSVLAWWLRRKLRITSRAVQTERIGQSARGRGIVP